MFKIEPNTYLPTAPSANLKPKKPLTEDELQKLKQIEEKKKAEKAALLFDSEALDQKKLKERNKEKEKEIHELVGGGQVSVYSKKQFNKMLLKSPVFRDVTFVEGFYDALYKLTGLEKSKENPHYKPEVFAIYTIKYIYRRFNIRNLMLELWERNPFLTGESFREFKHYQLLNDANYLKLLGFISDFMEVAKDYERKMFQFDIDYCKKYNLTTDTDMFYKGE